MSSPVNALIDASVSCSRCGTKGFMKCGCHEQCSCGWIADRGKPCNNPETTRCTTKLKYRPLPAFRKGERVRLIREAAPSFMPCGAVWGRDAYYATVAATPRANNDYVAVRWDGRTNSEYIAQWWLEKVITATLDPRDIRSLPHERVPGDVVVGEKG